MKTSRFFLILVFASSICSATAKGKEVAIVGNIKGNSTAKVLYSIPSGEVVGYAPVDSLGVFRISLSIEKPSFVSIVIPDLFQGMLVAEPGENYSVNFNQTGETVSFTINGKNEIGINYYNKSSESRYGTAAKYKGDTTSSLIAAKITERKKNELSTYKGFVANSKVSQEFYNLIEVDRECFYAALTIQNCQRLLSKLKNRETTQYKDLATLRSEVFSTYPPTQQRYFSCPSWHTYADIFITYKITSQEGFNIEELNKLSNFERQSRSIKDIQKLFEGEMLENLIFSYLDLQAYFQLENAIYDPEFILLFEDFKKNYPANKSLFLLEPYVQMVRKFEASKKETPLQGAKFLNNSADQTLNGVFLQLKGQSLYVDIWASWCNPCREEFKKMDESMRFLKEKGITVLYISIDKEDKDEKWRQFVQFLKLNGVHIRTNKKLYAELNVDINEGKPFGIPRYLLVNKEGKIVNFDAPRPSNLPQLREAVAALSN